VLALSAADGGYFPVSWGWAALALAWVAAAAIVLRERPDAGVLAVISFAGLAGLAGWIALSLVWTESVPSTVLEFQRTLVPLAGLAAALGLGAGAARGLRVGVAAAALVVGVWNLVAGGDAPIGYANGLALLSVLGVLLVAGLALEERSPWALLGAAVGAGVLLLVVWDSESRAALLALAGGAAAWLALRAPRPGLALTVVIAGAAVVLAAAGLRESHERHAYWSVAAEEAGRTAPLGSGAGTWGRVWLVHRGEALSARDAHSLYLEALSELGPVGLALVLAALVPPLVAAARAADLPGVRSAAGAYAAFVLHLGVDWDWELAAVALAGVLVGASLLLAAPGRAVAVPRRPALAALAAVGLLAAAGLAGNVATQRAADRLHAVDAAGGEHEARRATRLAPWAAEPWRLLGEAQRLAGDRQAAAASFRQGIDRDPGDVELWRALARVARGEELRRAVARAAQLDPLNAPRGT